MTANLPTYNQVEEFAENLTSVLHNASTDDIMSTARIIVFAQAKLVESLEKVQDELEKRNSYVRGCLNQIAMVLHTEQEA
jgi:hypothetical protein